MWGGTFPAIAVGLRSLDPILFASFRYDIAAVILLGYAAIRHVGSEPDDRADSVLAGDWLPRARNDRLAVLAGGVFLVTPNVFLFLGQQTVPSGVAAILQSLVPIATALWALFVLPAERVSRVGAVGIGLGLVGVGLIVRPDPAALLATGEGRLLILLQVAGVALGGVLIQRAAPSMDRTALSGWSMGLGGLCLHVASLAVGERPALPTTLDGWLAVAYLGVAATGIAFALYFRLLAIRGAVETSLVAYLVPIVATIIGVVFLDETITPLTIVGFLVVFVGFLLLKRRAIARLVDEIRFGSASAGSGR